MKDRWRRGSVVLGAAIASVALVVPVGAAGTCTHGYCFVPVPGAGSTRAAARGGVDDYWLDPASVTTRGSTAGEFLRTARATPASDGFDWSAFGIGLGVAAASMVLLGAIGAGAAGLRISRRATHSLESA